MTEPSILNSRKVYLHVCSEIALFVIRNVPVTIELMSKSDAEKKFKGSYPSPPNSSTSCR